MRLNANQYGALASWAYNHGCGTVAEATLIKRLNQGGDVNIVIEEEFPRYNSGGLLTKRRQREIDLCRIPSDQMSFPCA